jgi:hypothetical protein
MFFERKTGVFASAALAQSCQGWPVSLATALAARSGLYSIFGRGQLLLVLAFVVVAVFCGFMF